ncbi:MAG: CRISPR-associated endonuclease Cas6 [Bacteroidota bacterium]
MKSIPLTNITFDLPIYPKLLRKFRGAVIENVMQHKPVFEAAGVNTEIFHNHKEQVAVLEGGEDPLPPGADRFYDYPLVQYKVRHRKAGILGIGKGAQAIQLWLSMAGEHLTVDGQEVSLDVKYHHHSQWKPGLLEEVKFYRINKWLPFNKKNYDLWRQSPRLTDKVKLMEKVIWGHLFHLGQGLEIDIPKDGLELYMSTIDLQTYQDSFGIKKLAFDITFGTNLNLPDEIGLGQNVSIGFGKVQRISKQQPA